MKFLSIVLAIAIAVVCAASVQASPILLSGSGTPHNWTVADLNRGAFWANPSYDYNGLASVGYFLSGTPGSNVPGFYTNSPYEFAPYIGEGASTFRFTGESVQFLFGITGWRDTLSVIPTSPGVFALALSTPAGVWRSDELDAGRSHFAVFQGNGYTYVGVEDATFFTRPTADWDYNDAIYRIPDPQPVPEAGSMTMMGIGLIAIARKLRKVRK